MPDWRAGSRVDKYNAVSSKQGSKRFDSIPKDEPLAHQGMLFIFGIGTFPLSIKSIKSRETILLKSRFFWEYQICLACKP